MATAALAAGSSTVAPTTPDPVAAVLATRLQERFPGVTRWDIRKFADAPKRSDGTDSVSVVRLGARSAVRVGRQLEWYTVAGFQNVVSATRHASAGESLDARAGDIEERDVVRAGCEPLTDVSQLNGTRARSQLRAHDIICAQAIEPRPAVARGDRVTVRYLGARIELTTNAVAQQDGEVGDALLVRSAHSPEPYAARVSGVGEVAIHE